jgi:hypothetical protein
MPLALSLNDLVAVAERPWSDQMDAVFGCPDSYRPRVA